MEHNPYVYKNRAFVCPGCNEYPGVSHAMTIIGGFSFKIPYFKCSQCMLAHIHWGLIDHIIKRDRKETGDKTPLRTICYEIRIFMEEVQKDAAERLGYSFARRFKRTH